MHTEYYEVLTPSQKLRRDDAILAEHDHLCRQLTSSHADERHTGHPVTHPNLDELRPDR